MKTARDRNGRRRGIGYRGRGRSKCEIWRLPGAIAQAGGTYGMWPGLYPDDTGWSYDALSARHAALELLADLLPAEGAVAISEVIDIIRETEPDFSAR